MSKHAKMLCKSIYIDIMFTMCVFTQIRCVMKWIVERVVARQTSGIHSATCVNVKMAGREARMMM